MVYMGCAVQNGLGEGIVLQTGMKTKMGEIAHLLQTADEGDSPLKKKLHQLGIYLGVGSIVCSLFVFGIGWAYGKGDPDDSSPIWLQMLLVAVSLTVAAVPEGLPVCVTMSLAIGMKRMADIHKVRIMKLRSVETLGSASIICTDKTGTLTKGEMTAVRLWFNGETYQFTGEGYEPKGFVVPVDAKLEDAKGVEEHHNKLKNDPAILPVLIGVLNSNAVLQFKKEEQKWVASGNSTERPLVVAGVKCGLNRLDFKAYERVHENPFNSARKMASVLYEICSKEDHSEWFGGAKYVASVAGAPNYILDKCIKRVVRGGDGLLVRDFEDGEKAGILKVIDEFSEQALRVLAFSYRVWDEKPEGTTPEHLEGKLIFAGLMASIDPARSEVKPCIEKARNAGVRVVMITGDYVKTAKAIAENIGILPKGSPEESAVDCDRLRRIGDKLGVLEKTLAESKNKEEQSNIRKEISQLQKELDAMTEKANVFGRAKPVDKITIVKSYQRQGHICAMTGDGVNDAPALRQANIGIAMGITGTDVAKAAADMILLNDSFVGIIAAIEQGRTIYANIVKFVFYILSTNGSEVLLILIGVLMGLPPPLVPLQILWLNLTTDGAPAIALALEATEPNTMAEGPRAPDERLLDNIMLIGIVTQTLALTGVTLGSYIQALYWLNGSWDGQNENLSNEDSVRGRHQAQTMTIALIVFAELLRGYTCRSRRESLWAIGPFSNKYMQYSCLISVIATIFIIYCPGISDIFTLENLPGREWGFLLGMCFVPFVVDEIVKTCYRLTGYGVRPLIATHPPGSEPKTDVPMQSSYTKME